MAAWLGFASIADVFFFYTLLSISVLFFIVFLVKLLLLVATVVVFFLIISRVNYVFRLCMWWKSWAVIYWNRKQLLRNAWFSWVAWSSFAKLRYVRKRKKNHTNMDWQLSHQKRNIRKKMRPINHSKWFDRWQIWCWIYNCPTIYYCHCYFWINILSQTKSKSISPIVLNLHSLNATAVVVSSTTTTTSTIKIDLMWLDSQQIPYQNGHTFTINSIGFCAVASNRTYEKSIKWKIMKRSVTPFYSIKYFK